MPEGGVLPSSTGDDTLKVSVLANATDATVAYGDRHVVLIGGMYETESIFALPELGATNTYSYQIVTMPLDENARTRGFTAPDPTGWTAGALRYSEKTSQHQNMAHVYGIRYDMTFVNVAMQKAHKAWYEAYQAALADEALRADWRGGDHIIEAHYNALVALESADGVAAGTYAYTDEEIRYATWAGFEKLISGDMNSASDPVSSYYIENTKAPKSVPSGVTATVIHAGNPVWIANADGQDNSTNVMFSGRDYGTVFTRSDVATVTKNAEDSYFTWSYSRYLDGEAAKGVFEKANFKANDLNFSWYDIPAAFYAIRLYEKVLSDAEMAQNNFADLCNYYRIDNLDVYEKLNANDRAALHTAFKANKIGSVTKDELDEAIENAYLAKIEAIKAYAENVLTFDGYQMTLYEGVAFRACFSLNAENLPEGMTVLEIGVLSQIADEETALDSLTVAKGENGYESDSVKSSIVWETGVSSYLETVRFEEADLTREKLTENHIFRGYVIYECFGEEEILYTDMSSTVFADGLVSMDALASLETLADYPVSAQVKAIVDAE